VRGKSRVASCQRLSAEKPEQCSMLERVIALTHFQTRVIWHFRALKNQVQKMELSVCNLLLSIAGFPEVDSAIL